MEKHLSHFIQKEYTSSLNHKTLKFVLYVLKHIAGYRLNNSVLYGFTPGASFLSMNYNAISGASLKTIFLIF